MSMRHLLAVLVLAIGPSALHAQTTSPSTALQAVQALPAAYRQGVLKISADNGVPNPPYWYFIARDAGGRPESITMQGQQIIGEKRSFDLRTLIDDPSPIDFDKVQIDSTGAWEIAQKYASDKGRTLGSVSYALQQKGTASSPVWSVWCYDPPGNYIGLITLLATDGSIITSE